MNNRRYGLAIVADITGIRWEIQDYGDKLQDAFKRHVVATWPYEGDSPDGRPPAPVRAKYEVLLGRGEFVSMGEPSLNIVELIADSEDCAFDQPCLYGFHVESHAVYCHNSGWLYAPRKCRRGENNQLHADCGGFKANPGLTRCL